MFIHINAMDIYTYYIRVMWGMWRDVKVYSEVFTFIKEAETLMEKVFIQMILWLLVSED